jgi:fatty-acyl-CoA synthase
MPLSAPFQTNALPLTPLRCLERAVAVYPDKIGVVSNEKVFTFRELGERCGRLASALAALEVRRGDRIAYLSFNTNQLWEGYFGVPMAAGIFMPLNVRLSPSELAAILQHAEPVALIYEADFAAAVQKLRMQIPSIRHFIAIDDASDEMLHYENLLAQYAPAPINIYVSPDEETSELFYTSGSTGTPKGVMLSHRALYLHALACTTVQIDPATMVDLMTIPMFHANAWGRVHASTMQGVTQVMVRRFDAAAVLRMIERYRATDMAIIPLMGHALLNVPAAANYDLSSMRQIQIGGAASSQTLVEHLERLFKCQVYAGYGLTESGPVLAMARLKWDPKEVPDNERWRRHAMTGWSLPGATLRIVDERMQDLPRDERAIGELIASADWLMSGYYKDPEGSAAVLTGPNGEPGGVAGAPLWLHTGDMAVWDKESYITIMDRKKEIIISGGENISSLEIEKELYAHPAVLECAVVAAPDEKWGEVPAAIVVVKPGHTVTEDELLAHLNGRLSRFKLPRLIHFVSEPLPKTGTGKIRKMDLREPFWHGLEKRVKG